MSTRLKVLMAGVVVALALLSASGIASALRSLEVGREAQTLVLNGRLTFVNAAGNIICNFTFTKTVSARIPKISGTLVGKVTRVDVPARLPEENCRQNNFSLERWNFLLEGEERGRIFYNTILGTLPRITGILLFLKQFRFGWTSSGIGPCLYEAPAEGIGMLAEINAEILGNLRFLRNTETRTRESSALCPASFEWTGTLIPLQRTTIRLI